MTRSVYRMRTVVEPDVNGLLPTVESMSQLRHRPLARWLFAVPLVALLVADLTGCGSSGDGKASPAAGTNSNKEVSPAGDIPDTQTYVPFTFTAGHITVKVPEGWGRSEAGGAVRFSDRFNAVELSSTAKPTAPSLASARQDEVAVLKASVAGFAGPKVSTATRPAGSVVLITYQADSPKDPVTGKSTRLAVERYEYWKNGTETIVTVSGPVGADNVDPWKTVTGSVAWT